MTDNCNHAWQPMADQVRIWQRCVKCEMEEHVTTHDEALAANVEYIFRDLARKKRGA